MKRLFGLFFGLAALAFAGVAQASVVISINAGALPGGDRAVTCEGPFCQGFYDPGYVATWPSDESAFDYASTEDAFKELVLSPDPVVSGASGFSTAWNLPDSSEDTIEDFLNLMLPVLGRAPVDSSTVQKFDGDKPAGFTFSTAQEYFWIKQGKWTAYFANPNPGQLVTVTISGGGISNYGVAGVPIPAAFVLFGSGLVGLGWLARRQRARKEESVA